MTAGSTISCYENKIYKPGRYCAGIGSTTRTAWLPKRKSLSLTSRSPRECRTRYTNPKAHQYSSLQTSPEERVELARMLKTCDEGLQAAWAIRHTTLHSLGAEPERTSANRDYSTIRDDFHGILRDPSADHDLGRLRAGSGIDINPLNPTDAAKYLRRPMWSSESESDDQLLHRSVMKKRVR